MCSGLQKAPSSSSSYYYYSAKMAAFAYIAFENMISRTTAAWSSSVIASPHKLLHVLLLGWKRSLPIVNLNVNVHLISHNTGDKKGKVSFCKTDKSL